MICVASIRAAKLDEKRRLKVNSLVVEMMAVTMKYATGPEGKAEVPFEALVADVEAEVPLPLDDTLAGGMCVALASRHAAATAGATDVRWRACTVSRRPRVLPLPLPLKKWT